MTRVLEKQDAIQIDFEALKQSADREPVPLRSVRDQAMNRFRALGWPTTKNEQWRFTSVKPISGGGFRVPKEKPAVDPGFVRERLIDDRVYLVFVNGVFDVNLSKLDGLPDSVRLQSLNEAVHDPRTLEVFLNGVQAEKLDAFTALNTAFSRDGLLLHVPRGIALSTPIQVIHLADGNEPAAIHTRNLIVLEPSAEVTLVESFYSHGEGVSWTNSFTDARLGENARLTHYFRELQNEKAHHTSGIEVHQERDSRFDTHHLLLGGVLVRNNIHVVLDGPGAEADISCLFVGHGGQHQDNYIFVDHAQPHCRSGQFVKGMLDDRAKGVFTGKVVVRPDAQKTDAHQINRNLLLSGQAKIDTQPQLEIYADDVKCAHGATTGQIDEDAMFYLRARGLDPDSAMDLLRYAFAHEVIERMPLETVRRQAESVLFERFSKARMLGEES